MKSCFHALATGLHDQLADPDLRPEFDHHQACIAALIASQPDLIADEDTCAGLLHGFLTAGQSNPTHQPVPVLGGILLLALNSDSITSPARPDRFFVRLDTTLRAEPIAVSASQRAAAEKLVHATFAATPDVPIGLSSLAGFVLGLLYSAQCTANRDGTGLIELIEAVRLMAHTLHPRSDDRRALHPLGRRRRCSALPPAVRTRTTRTRGGGPPTPSI